MAGGLAAVLILAGCASGSDSKAKTAAGQPASEAAPSVPAPSTPAPDAAAPATESAPAPDASTPAPTTAGAATPAPQAATGSAAPGSASATPTPAGKSAASQGPAASRGGASAPGTQAPKAGGGATPVPGSPAPAPAAGGAGGGATDVGVTADSIKLGGIFMYGYALGNLAVQPMHREMEAIVKAVNDTGGIHGRRLNYVDCDDGAPDPARTRACYKKLVEQEKIFAFMGGITFMEAQYQKDQERDKIPHGAPGSLYRETWQNPWAFPIHMDMTQEAYANADWVMKVHKVKKFGIICLNNAEMLAACQLAEAYMTKLGAQQVFKRVYQPGTPDMSGDIVAARAAGPEHILHYTVDPTVTVRFFIDAQQQNYWPPKGMSGNHMALEVIGGLMGEFPATKGYWTNTTYKLWGADYIAWQRKFAPNNKGLAHHVTQGQWFGSNAFLEAFKKVGPNLTREAVKNAMYQGEYATGPSLGQKFMWEPSKRYAEGYGNTKEYMYKYVNKNTTAKDDGATGEPTGFIPAPEGFEIFAPAVNPHTGTGK
jgi:ABC-type branched-subunit amino acid transport system substrate-binding protein